MLVKILKLWDIPEMNKVPKLNTEGKPMFFVNPETGATIPQWELRPYQVGDQIELTDPTYHFKNGLAAKIDQVTGKEIDPVEKLPAGAEGTKSGRVYFDKVFSELDKDAAKLTTFVDNKRESLLNELSRTMLIELASRIVGVKFRETWLDSQTEMFLRTSREAIRVTVADFIDNRVFQINQQNDRNN